MRNCGAHSKRVEIYAFIIKVAQLKIMYLILPNQAALQSTTPQLYPLITFSNPTCQTC